MTTDNTTNAPTNARQLRGIVVGDKSDKTIRVQVTRLKMHPKYKKQFKVTHTFAAHDPENAYHVGDKVIIRETRPLSKSKRWIVVGKVNPAIVPTT